MIRYASPLSQILLGVCVLFVWAMYNVALGVLLREAAWLADAGQWLGWLAMAGMQVPVLAPVIYLGSRLDAARRTIDDLERRLTFHQTAPADSEAFRRVG